jgi:alkylation response protein AidB-like acyl-CoA dehydrogenase
MDFSLVDLDEDHRVFAEEVRAFFDEHVTEEVHAHERETGDGFDEKIHRGLGAKGWLMPTWPVASGGIGADPLTVRILELEYSRARTPSVTLGTTRLVAGAVEMFAGEDLASEVLPLVASGDVRFCLGYTEPDGGSDIAAARTRAVRDGDEWVINGAKVFTTGAHNCQYTFLITRTDPDLPKHKGLTMFLVPLHTPGVEISPIRTFSGERTNMVFYSDVRIADRYRLGGVNEGWSVLHGPLDAEHSVGTDSASGLDDLSIGVSFVHALENALDAALSWANTSTLPDGTHPIDSPLVRYRLGKVAVDIEAALSTPGPMGRVKGSDALVRGAADLLDLVGPAALLPHGADGAVGGGDIDFAHRYAQGTATYGGTVEVFRTIIAQHVLGLPRPEYPGRKFLASAQR